MLSESSPLAVASTDKAYTPGWSSAECSMAAPSLSPGMTSWESTTSPVDSLDSATVADPSPLTPTDPPNETTDGTLRTSKVRSKLLTALQTSTLLTPSDISA